VEEFYSNLSNLKQLHSTLGNEQPLNLKFSTIRNVWVNSNILNQIWVIEAASFKFGQNWKRLGKSVEVHSYLGISGFYLRKMLDSRYGPVGTRFL